jgi:hypothetical protein
MSSSDETCIPKIKVNIKGCCNALPQSFSFPVDNLPFLRQMRELTIFEHQEYGRIVVAAFDTVLIIVVGSTAL